MVTPSDHLLCWVVSDGRAGIENQALGLAKAVKHAAGTAADGSDRVAIEVKRIRLRLPWSLCPAELFPVIRWLPKPLAMIARDKDHIDPPWPDLLIATGRASIPFSLAVKIASGGKTFTVQTQKPRCPASLFDLVIPPRHDRLTGPNVEPILGAPNKIDQAFLDKGRHDIATRIAHLPRPLIAVLIGGASKQHKMPTFWTEQFCADLRAVADKTGAGLMVTASRRTGPRNAAMLKAKLAGRNTFFWDGSGTNPYAGMLATADYFVVTSDSTNMIGDAATTGKPVYVAYLPGGSPKFRRFYDDMAACGAIRPFAGAARKASTTGSLEHWSYPPLRETGRVAELILNRLR